MKLGFRTTSVGLLTFSTIVSTVYFPKNIVSDSNPYPKFLFSLILVVEVIRVLKAFDCSYNEGSVRTQFWDALVLVSFMVAMWALFVFIKNEQVIFANSC